MLKIISLVIFFAVMTFIVWFLVNSPWQFAAGIVVGALSVEWYYTSQPRRQLRDRYSKTESDQLD